jgi:uncharacterized protein YndB with AHSA1/START domain
MSRRFALGCVLLLTATYACAADVQVSRPSDKETAITTTFDAPRKLIFDALTRPDLLKRWYAPEGWTLAACDIDLKAGGAYRMVWRRPSGTELAMQGVYREVKASERLIRTALFEPAWSGGGQVETTVLRELAGKTSVIVTVLYESSQARDSDAASAEHGATGSFARLAALLKTLQ